MFFTEGKSNYTLTFPILILFQYDILPDDIVSRICFATTVMHAYGHEWACQLTYNPRIIQGLGLSDGEGTERLWSRFTKLIGIERTSSVCMTHCSH